MGTNNANMGIRNSNKNKKGKKRGAIIAACSLVVIVVVAVLLLKNIGNTVASASVISYQVEEITYGDVSTTISGSGTLTPVSSKTLTPSSSSTIWGSYSAEVTSIKFTVGDEVEEDDVILTVKDSNGNKKNIKAPYDGVIIDLPVAVGDDVSKDTELVTVIGKDGFTIELSVDELSISSVSIGQEVSVTVDAVEGNYTGSVSNISYMGTTSGSVTSYKVLVRIDYAEGMYPGMSASANIMIESSGDGLLVPVEAVRTSGDDSYIYLAPSGAEAGMEYGETEIDLSKLTKVNVTTGMSDGTYIRIENAELAEGDLIIIVRLTSTATGSSSDDTESFPNRGGNGDFGNFDPSNMPDFPSGGGFGN